MTERYFGLMKSNPWEWSDEDLSGFVPENVPPEYYATRGYQAIVLVVE